MPEVHTCCLTLSSNYYEASIRGYHITELRVFPVQHQRWSAAELRNLLPSAQSITGWSCITIITPCFHPAGLQDVIVEILSLFFSLVATELQCILLGILLQWNQYRTYTYIKINTLLLFLHNKFKLQNAILLDDIMLSVTKN